MQISKPQLDFWRVLMNLARCEFDGSYFKLGMLTVCSQNSIQTHPIRLKYPVSTQINSKTLLGTKYSAWSSYHSANVSFDLTWKKKLNRF